jgi:hypothetical protein
MATPVGGPWHSEHAADAVDILQPATRVLSGVALRSPDLLGHDPVRDIINGVPGTVAALGRDARMEHGPQQDIAQLLAHRPLIAGLQSLCTRSWRRQLPR